MKTKLIALLCGLGLSSGAMAISLTEVSTMSMDVDNLPFSFGISKSFGASTSFEHTWNIDFASASQIVGLISDMEIGTAFNISGFQINVDSSGWVSLPGDFLTGVGTIGAGLHTLQIKGYADGTYGGAYAFNFSAVPVPETETWAMLLAGLGVVGLRMRKQLKQEKRLAA